MANRGALRARRKEFLIKKYSELCELRACDEIRLAPSVCGSAALCLGVNTPSQRVGVLLPAIEFVDKTAFSHFVDKAKLHEVVDFGFACPRIRERLDF
jgi:hypothetical protein